MMRFQNSARDGEFMAGLRDAGILTPDLIDRIDAAMGRPDSGALTDFLLAGAEIIPELAWLTWLIRRHGCHRVGPVALQPDTLAAIANRDALGDNLPYRFTADDSLLIAVVRPDRWAEEAQLLTPRRCIKVAATLREARALRTAWRHPVF
ncbi:MAG: hypothetical protein Q8N18_20370 [Opitutaceae bacterium]|nr:hypothetical protein [Opitutaceae bacterium]